MIPNAITAEHVLAAIAEIDREGVPARRGATRYRLVHQGRCYPPKYVMSLAAKFAVGQALPPEKFNGGNETNSYLQSLGFEIARPRDTLNHEPEPSRVRTEGPTATHGEHCQECKARLLTLLRAVFGEVENQKRFQIGTVPKDFACSEWYGRLTEIFAALQRERGFTDFVKAAVLPTCDYFLPGPALIIEFDEKQHFTPLRERALSLYPSSIPLGFDREQWAAHCRKIRASDNDPPYRDEQRAWYDTLRDFLPTVFPLYPTVRLSAREHDWCKLNADDRKDVERFRQILSDRAHLWTIEARNTESPQFGRVIMDGAWSGDANAGRRLLGDVASVLPINQRLACLCTCGAFLTFEWPENLVKQGNLAPTSACIDSLIAAAESAVSRILTDDIIARLRDRCDCLTLGVDTKKSKVSTACNAINEPHAELVCIVDLRHQTFRWTGKFYPTTGQERTIVRFPDLASHFVDLNCAQTMIVGCHDLSVYSSRGQAKAKADGWRRQIASEFRALARRLEPSAVLHHPHTTVKCRTWAQQWRELEKELPSVKEYLGTGAYSYKDDGWDKRDVLDDVLSATKRGEVVDVVVRLACCPTRKETPQDDDYEPS